MRRYLILFLAFPLVGVTFLDEVAKKNEEGNRLFEEGKYEEALEAIEKALLRDPDAGHHLGFHTTVLGHLQRPEAKTTLERYLALRPNLKTRDDYRSIFVPNSTLADPIIEGLIKAGWNPED